MQDGPSVGIAELENMSESNGGKVEEKGALKLVKVSVMTRSFLANSHLASPSPYSPLLCCSDQFAGVIFISLDH